MSALLTIAGSDPSGGAGIQQDLRVFSSFHRDGLSAITAVTVQNSEGVRFVHPIPAGVLYAQIEALLEDTWNLGGVKIGMLGGADQVLAVTKALLRFKPENVVLDPVLFSTGGVPLLDAEGRAALISNLLPLCDLVTPNVDEAALLTGMAPIQDAEGVRAAGKRLIERGAKAALITGGHLSGSPDDTLFLPNREPHVFVGTRVETKHTHGTGCFLSSAILACHAMVRDLPMAIKMAKRDLERGLERPRRPGRGRGYPDAFASDSPEGRGKKNLHVRLRGLYVITDSELRSDRSHVEIARAALAGGAKIVQLRDKVLPTDRLIEVAREIRKLCDASDALFIVNDRVDVALAADADGVHLGPGDMSPQDATELFLANRIVGVSVNSVEEAKAVMPFSTYLGVGAIFGSATKNDAGEAIGVERLREIKAAFPDLAPGYPYPPIVAIGGINAGSIDAVIEAGADAAAVISAVVCAPDMEAATRELCGRFEAHRQKKEMG